MFCRWLFSTLFLVSSTVLGQDLSVFDASPQERTEAVDLSMFSPHIITVPVTAMIKGPKVDLSMFDEEPVMTKGSEKVDLSVFDILPKSSQSSLPTPGVPTTRWSYPIRYNHWTHPGVGRDGLINHLIGESHGMKYAEEKLRQMSALELESLHSDHHEGKVSPFLEIELPPEKPTQLSPSKSFVGTTGLRYYQGSDGVYRTSKEDGVKYCESRGTLHTAPVQMFPTIPKKTFKWLSPCPNGVCPVQ